MIKNLIFDIDGTIWNSTEVVAQAWRQAVKETGISDIYITAEMLKKEFGKPMDAIFESLFPHLTERKKIDDLAEIIYRFEHQYLEESTDELTYPKVKETIAELSKDYNIYIVSNCQDGYIELVNRKTGIGEYIKDWDCFGVTRLPKSGTIRLVVERNNLVADETIYIGDTMGDYLATKEAGLRFLFAEYGFGEVENPDLRASSFEDIKNALKSFTC